MQQQTNDTDMNEDFVTSRYDAASRILAPLDMRPRVEAAPRSSQRPLQQYGSSEAVTSVAWLPRHPGLVSAGMGLKYLRVYDVRAESSSPPAIVLNTRAVYGINVRTLSDAG
jgi:hypothetical protein